MCLGNFTEEYEHQNTALHPEDWVLWVLRHTRVVPVIQHAAAEKLLKPRNLSPAWKAAKPISEKNVQKTYEKYDLEADM